MPPARDAGEPFFLVSPNGTNPGIVTSRLELQSRPITDELQLFVVCEGGLRLSQGGAQGSSSACALDANGAINCNGGGRALQVTRSGSQVVATAGEVQGRGLSAVGSALGFGTGTPLYTLAPATINLGRCWSAGCCLHRMSRVETPATVRMQVTSHGACRGSADAAARLPIYLVGAGWRASMYISTVESSEAFHITHAAGGYLNINAAQGGDPYPFKQGPDPTTEYMLRGSKLVAMVDASSEETEESLIVAIGSDRLIAFKGADLAASGYQYAVPVSKGSRSVAVPCWPVHHSCCVAHA
jgi:hypothetical protein